MCILFPNLEVFPSYSVTALYFIFTVHIFLLRFLLSLLHYHLTNYSTNKETTDKYYPYYVLYTLHVETKLYFLSSNTNSLIPLLLINNIFYFNFPIK